MLQATAAAGLGISQPTLSHWENNISLPGVDQLNRLAVFYELHFDHLAGKLIDPAETTKKAS